MNLVASHWKKSEHLQDAIVRRGWVFSPFKYGLREGEAQERDRQGAHERDRRKARLHEVTDGKEGGNLEYER